MAEDLAFTEEDVLRRAYKLVEAGPLPGRNNCSDYCPWCAIATAKSQLGREHGVELPLSELFGFVVTGLPAVCATDGPLIAARTALNEAVTDADTEPFTRDAALALLRRAMDRVGDRRYGMPGVRRRLFRDFRARIRRRLRFR
jgi:hypothetical protein